MIVIEQRAGTVRTDIYLERGVGIGAGDEHVDNIGARHHVTTIADRTTLCRIGHRNRPRLRKYRHDVRVAVRHRRGEREDAITGNDEVIASIVAQYQAGTGKAGNRYTDGVGRTPGRWRCPIASASATTSSKYYGRQREICYEETRRCLDITGIPQMVSGLYAGKIRRTEMVVRDAVHSF